MISPPEVPTWDSNEEGSDDVVGDTTKSFDVVTSGDDDSVVWLLIELVLIVLWWIVTGILDNCSLPLPQGGADSGKLGFIFIKKKRNGK